MHVAPAHFEPAKMQFGLLLEEVPLFLALARASQIRTMEAQHAIHTFLLLHEFSLMFRDIWYSSSKLMAM
jgi:hypothetical protein